MQNDRAPWYTRLFCWLKGHEQRTVIAFPEVGTALTITGCFCGKHHEVTGIRCRFPMPAQKVRRLR